MQFLCTKRARAKPSAGFAELTAARSTCLGKAFIALKNQFDLDDHHL